MFAAAACGGPLDPGAGDDPGGGTRTLVVTGSVQARNRLVNARTNAEFDTDVSVRVTLNGQNVSTGTVTISTASGTVPLVADRDNGRWSARLPGYEEVYLLDIQAGPDEVTGVRVDGPDPFTFTAPTAGATVDATMPISVTWSCDDTAESAAIRADELDALAIADTGKFSLPPRSLRTDRDKPRANTLRITRTNHLAPAGAAGGSDFAVSITNEIDVLAAADPTK
ncbi:MAG: hypothetical protein KF773_36540 [Deltaproteobacteria bacterium]|nr:hypothetical protein [Deltaproteobacteria bacterium]MCW5807789.1 hypothetical protein [Deltaproteobacteria bacterium]